MGWNLIRPSFLFMLNNNKETKLTGVEIGVANGDNAFRMLSYCDRLYLNLVDIKTTPTMLDMIKQFDNRTKLFKQPSMEAADEFSDKFFDYIYIDASHEYDDVREDLTAWYPKIKEGGVFAGHDWWYEGVNKAVLEFFKIKQQRLYAVQNFYTDIIPTEDAEMMDWWIKKV